MAEKKATERTTKPKEEETGILPILPVRDTVLFPHAVLPLTVVIVNFRTPDLTGRAVHSLRSVYPSVPLLLIDNGSGDEDRGHAGLIGTEVAKACLREFLSSQFTGGRHIARLEKLARIEAEEAGR